VQAEAAPVTAVIPILAGLAVCCLLVAAWFAYQYWQAVRFERALREAEQALAPVIPIRPPE
jgi:hypothetical protein